MKKLKGMFETMGQKYYDRINQAVIAADFRMEFKDDVVFVSDPEKEAKKAEKKANREARIERRKEKLRKLSKKEAEDKEVEESKVEETTKEDVKEETDNKVEETKSEKKEKPQRYQRGKSKKEIEELNKEEVENSEAKDEIAEEIQKRKEAVSANNDESLDDVVNKLVNMAYGDGLIMNQTVNGDGIIEYECWDDFARVNNLDNNIDHNSWLDTDDVEYMNGFEEGKKVATKINQKLMDALDTQQEIGKEEMGLA